MTNRSPLLDYQMPFSVTITRVFCAAHALRLPDGSVEPLHGHNWELRVTVARQTLDNTGFVVDFHDLETQLDAIIRPLNNRNLSDIPEMQDLNATAENVCWHVARSLKLPAGSGVVLESVEVTEAPGCSARYRP